MCALPQLPCGCCEMPLGQQLIAWIRCWLQPGMYLFETEPAPLGPLLPMSVSWHPHLFESATYESPVVGRTSHETMVLTTTSQLDNNKVEWLLVAAKADSAHEQLRLCNDNFGLWFRARFDPSRTLPLVGFSPAYLALIAVRHLQLWTPLPDVLARVVYEYLKCNV